MLSRLPATLLQPGRLGPGWDAGGRQAKRQAQSDRHRLRARHRAAYFLELARTGHRREVGGKSIQLKIMIIRLIMAHNRAFDP